MLRRYPLNRDGTFIEIFATDHNLWRTLMALHFVNKYFFGMKRRDGSDEVSHCTRVCCDLIDRGATHFLSTEELDRILSIALLHDTIENTVDTDNPVTADDIAKIFDKDIADDVDRLTKRPEHKHNPEKYFERVSGSVFSIVVKAVDKENVAGTIIEVAKTVERLERQVAETEMLLPIMKKARNEYSAYKGILISARNHLKSILIGMKAHIKVLKEKEGLERNLRELAEEHAKLSKKRRTKKPSSVEGGGSLL